MNDTPRTHSPALRRFALPLAVAALFLAGCGGPGEVSPGHGGHDDVPMGATGYGESADPADAARTIEVAVDDGYAFTPSSWEVATGEVVTFVVVNSGSIEHEFVLGDEAAQQRMEEEMSSGEGHDHAGGMSNAVTIPAGGSGSLTWRFPDAPAQVLVGCHLPGHYDAGMRGVIEVS